MISITSKRFWRVKRKDGRESSRFREGDLVGSDIMTRIYTTYFCSSSGSENALADFFRFGCLPAVAAFAGLHNGTAKGRPIECGRINAQ